MRIALIAPPWAPVPPDHYGGIEAVVHELAVGFQAAGHEVLLCAPGDSTCPVPRHPVIKESEGGRIGETVPELHYVMKAYDVVQDYDVIHDHTIIGPVYAQRFPSLNVVTTIHSQLGETVADIYRRIASRSSVVAISATQCESVTRMRVAAVIHHGLDAGSFPFGDTRGDYCLFLGRMAPEKGAHRAIRAAKRAGVPLVLAGKKRSRDEEQYFEHHVAPLLDDADDIFYVGEVPHERKLDLLVKARCLLFPIRWPEPFGIVLLEALACGTPVVAFAEGAVSEIIRPGRTGFICRDESDMAWAIHRVNELDRAACRLAVEEHFSARRMVADHLALFERIVTRRQHAPPSSGASGEARAG